MFRSRTKSKSRPGLSTRRRFRPRLDVLEVREVLSTLVVTSPADSGPGTLRDRVSAAASGDVVTFAPSLIGQTITLIVEDMFTTDRREILKCSPSLRLHLPRRLVYTPKRLLLPRLP